MAFGFLKKIFSFGKKEVIEVPQEGEAPAEAAALLTELPAPEIEAAPPAVEYEGAIAAADDAPFEPPADVINAAEPEPVTAAPAAPPAPKPQPKPAKPKPVVRAPAPVEPEPAAEPVAIEAAVTELAEAEILLPELQQETILPEPELVDEPAAEEEASVPETEAEAFVPEQELVSIESVIAEESEAETTLLEPHPEPPAPGPDPAEKPAALAATNAYEAEVETFLPEPVPEIELAAPEPDAPAGKVLIGATQENTFVPTPEPQENISWFGRLKKGLSRSSKELTSSITGIFTKRKLDEDTLQELEDVLIQADLGMETALRITDALSSGRYGKQIGGDEVRAIMSAEIEKVLIPVARPLELDLSHKPHVILVVGVNGTGKTTTIGKLSAKLREAKLNVWLAAGDTFRAAAIEQLHIWGERTGSPVVSTKIGADAAGLAYDAYEKAKTGGADVLIIDTAGRLQNRTELMDELAKIVRVLNKLDPDSPHTVLQTLDATTGQNALSQVEIFKNIAGVNGLVMTKLDGTARGGILVAIAARHKLPVYFVGVGETVDDLEPFSAKEFASAIAGTD
jgi:fused signal recognition particle receptor